MSEIKIEDLFALCNEIDLGASDKSRTINSITDVRVKDIIIKELTVAQENHIDLTTKDGRATNIVGGAVVGGIVAAGGAAAVGGAVAAGGAAAVGGAVAGGGAIYFLGAGGAAAEAAVAGAAAGSVLPVVGTVVGAVVGAAVGIGVGFALGNRKKKKEDHDKEQLKQTVIAKQNNKIKQLENELEELKAKYGEAAEQNDRYKYILSLLMANKELSELLKLAG